MFVLKDEADWENLIFLGSVFQRVGARERERAFTVRFGIDIEMECTVAYTVV